MQIERPRRAAAGGRPLVAAIFFILYIYSYILEVPSCQFSWRLTEKNAGLYSFKASVHSFWARLYVSPLSMFFSAAFIFELHTTMHFINHHRYCHYNYVGKDVKNNYFCIKNSCNIEKFSLFVSFSAARLETLLFEILWACTCLRTPLIFMTSNRKWGIFKALLNCISTGLPNGHYPYPQILPAHGNLYWNGIDSILVYNSLCEVLSITNYCRVIYL